MSCMSTTMYHLQFLDAGSLSVGSILGCSDLRMGSCRTSDAQQISYRNLYPLRSKAVFGPSGMTGQVGWGAAALNDRLEEDVGRLLAELRLGTTAVDMN